MSSFASLDELEKHLSTRSYITGYSLSEDDKRELRALGSLPSPSTHPNAYRWATHIVALTGIYIGSNAAAGDKKSSVVTPAKKVAKVENDDEIDLFGDEEEEEKKPAAGDDDLNLFDEEDGETAEERAATKARQARMAQAKKLKEEKDAAEGKTKKKEKAVEKSLVVLEVKPWEADTDLEAVWREIIKFEKEGLTWGETFKLEPVAYGIKKLVLTCTIVDSLIVLDDITESIEAMEDYVQSVEIASMNKI